MLGDRERPRRPDDLDLAIEARRLDTMRRDFVANVSHELKTPVAGIRALAEAAATALEADDLHSGTRFVARLGVEAARLSDLVADLLDLSRIEAGELAVSAIQLDLLLREAVDAARERVEAKGLRIELERTDVRVLADRAQLLMAVGNLIDNAIRYSENGTISVAAECSDSGISISVADEGIGIPQEATQRIFERFYRIDKARSRAAGGTGLGLAIVRHVAENHQGAVTVTSEPGSGSTFRLRLPRQGHVSARL